MKQKKGMIGLLVVLAVLIIVYVTLSQWNKHTKEQEEEEAANSLIPVTNAENVTSLRYTDGEQTMRFVKEELWII